MLKKNITRKHLSNKIYKSIGFSKRISSKIIDDFIEVLISEIIKSTKVKITTFGTFQVINKSERFGRNPKTKVPAKIISRKIVKFKPSQIFKERINNAK